MLLRIDENCYWFAQADGDMFSWYKANSENLNVEVKEPNVFVSQIQGPKSMELLDNLIDETVAKEWNYFDWAEVTMAGEKVIVSRTGFTNELGWEIYFRPENNAEKLGDLILNEGSKMGMIITATPSFRGRRIEAGLFFNLSSYYQYNLFYIGTCIRHVCHAPGFSGSVVCQQFSLLYLSEGKKGL